MAVAFNNLLEETFEVNHSPGLQKKFSIEKKWFCKSRQMRHASLETHFQHNWVTLSPPICPHTSTSYWNHLMYY